MTVVMVIYLSQTTPVRLDLSAMLITGDSGHISHQMTQVSSQGDISQPDNTSKDLTTVLITRDSASMNSMEGNNDEMWFLDDDYVVEDEEQLVDEGEHDIPFNIADVPQQLVTADAHTQREVHLGLYEQQPASGRDHVTKFKASGVKGMWMSMLQSMHDNKRVMAAVGLLRQWHQIMMDGEYMVDVNGANMVAHVRNGCSDSMIGGRPPLECKATAEPVDMTVARHANDRMALGTCMDEQLWLAMVPNMYFEEGYGENREEVVPVLESKTTALSMEHRYMMIMFITHMLDSM
ncbi:hypothetical protein EDC04DRAFT_2613129 [Pisolithus marmoratus]|nr:hypothetical protein EDC04DRAFT_2613129 [Pisolithus marmoratus]